MSHETAFDEYVSQHYVELKRGKDEDVFHDTLIQCRSHYDGVSDVSHYINRAYHVNAMREKQYARNRFRNDEDVNVHETCHEDTYANVLIDDVRDIITRRFGAMKCEMYMLHANGVPIHELEKTYDAKDMYYQLRRIQNYLKQMFLIESKLC